MNTLEKSRKFRNWKNNLKKHGIVLEEYKVLNTIYKSDGKLLFAFLSAKMRTPEGEYLPPLVFLRGDFVSVLIHFIATDTGKNYTLLVKQRRVATGEFFYEFPAGMCDETEDPFLVAVKEVEEETGIQISKNDLQLLHEKHLFSSPGLLDEAGYYFACRLHKTEKEIFAYHRQKQGAISENEHILTQVVPLEEAGKYIKNVHGVLHWKLYLEYRKDV